MNMEIKISFIIPVYNAEKYINQCIDSIIEQKFYSWELIIVDDGSTDATVNICNDYAKKDRRIKIIGQKNSGSAIARNSGLKLAKGEWIAFIDGDDWIESDFYEKLQVYMEKDFDFIMYSYYEISGMMKKNKCSIKETIVLDKEIFRLIIKDTIDTERRATKIANSRAQLWTKIYRREFLNNNQISMDSKLRMSQDVMFNLEVYTSAKKAVFIPNSLYNYRLLTDSTCHQYNVHQAQRIINLMNAMGNYVKKVEWKQEAEILYQKRILVSLVNICRLDICHRDNTLNYFERRKKFFQLCMQEPFKNALKVNIICRFSLKKQICMWLVKFRLFYILDWGLKRY